MRIYSIDYLRGLMAISILFYHITAWTIGTPQSGSLLGKLGIYGVSIFYIISGISMYVSYKNTTWNIKSTRSFFIKRFFRLAPVYWLALLIVISYATYRTQNFQPNWENYFYNFTLSFGLFSPRNYMVTGGWSIGNEVVFYLFFPLLILSFKNKMALIITTTLIFSFYIYFCFIVLDKENSLASQWLNYINPLNQAFLFMSGMLIAWISEKISIKNNTKNIMLAFILIMLFYFFPSGGDAINIVTSWNRIFFTAIIMLLCFFILNVKLTVSNSIGKMLKILGDISYPVYLLHGIIYFIISDHLTDSKEEKFIFLIVTVTLITLCSSFFIYKKVEQPIIRLAKTITN